MDISCSADEKQNYDKHTRKIEDSRHCKFILRKERRRGKKNNVDREKENYTGGDLLKKFEKAHNFSET
jgi:hypothetical protein